MNYRLFSYIGLSRLYRNLPSYYNYVLSPNINSRRVYSNAVPIAMGSDEGLY
jgi:hypothetical protein